VSDSPSSSPRSLTPAVMREIPYFLSCWPLYQPHVAFLCRRQSRSTPFPSNNALLPPRTDAGFFPPACYGSCPSFLLTGITPPAGATPLPLLDIFFSLRMRFFLFHLRNALFHSSGFDDPPPDPAKRVFTPRTFPALMINFDCGDPPPPLKWKTLFLSSAKGSPA